MRFKKLPPLEYIKEILDYDPDTGVFTWKQKLSQKQNIGDTAGSIDGKGYRILRIRKSNYKAHRIAYYYVTGCDPAELQIDHINQVKNDNRYQNLRLVTNSRNQHNNKRTGVHKHSDGKWTAVFTLDKVKHYLGLFDTQQEALTAHSLKKEELLPAY